jgi:hypothetical protein
VRMTMSSVGPRPEQVQATGNQAVADEQPRVLAEAEVSVRMLLLAELQAALAASAVRCVLARNHRLVLRSSEAPFEPSGLTDPSLYVLFDDRTRSATTDGTTYRLDNGEELPVGDPVAVAALICRAQMEPGVMTDRFR